MKRITLIIGSITFLMLTAFAVRLFLQTNTRSGLELARLMPGGALAYIEARDLSGLLGRWMSSPAHQRYFASSNWKQFQRSRLYLKFRQRLQPIEAALGVEITDERVESLTGGRSALGVYNIGELEVLFITEMNRQRAFASELFKQRASFRERSVDGLLYYVREGSDEEGRRTAQAAFAFLQGKLLIASNENLLRRALTNVKGASEDQLSLQMARLTETLTDFAPHDVTIWLDQRRLNSDRYFRNYWIHANLQELREIEAALIDLEIAGDAWRERRWFALSEATQESRQPIGSLNDLLRFAPADTQLLTVTAPKDIKTLSHLAADVLLGAMPTPSSPLVTNALPLPYGEYSQEPSPLGGYWRYASLDDRFNKDIDDPTSYTGDGPRGIRPPEAVSKLEEFAAGLADILQPAQPTDLMSLGEAALGENRLFVYFNRALIIKLARADTFRPQEFEKALREEFTARYVVQGVPDHLEWKVSGGVHSLSQAMLDRGGAYAFVGDYLILANRAEYCERILQAYKESNASAQSQTASLERFAQVRLPQGKETYKHVMEMLAVPKVTDEANAPIDLFSDNVAGLIDVVPDLNSVTIETEHAARFLREVAIYKFEEPR